MNKDSSILGNPNKHTKNWRGELRRLHSKATTDSSTAWQALLWCLFDSFETTRKDIWLDLNLAWAGHNTRS